MVRVISTENGVFLQFLLALIVVCAVFPEPAVPSVAPVLQVQIETQAFDSEKPSWKENWDEARQLARGNQLHEAQKAYLELFEEKPNIIEARWEYCKLLLLLGQSAEAFQVLEGLLELEPNNLDYLIAAGTTALEIRHYSKAVEFFGQAYEADPYGPLSTSAIKGLIRGFQELNNDRSAFLLLEQLYKRQGGDSSLLYDLASSSTRLGLLEKARFFYDRLVELFPDNGRYILEAAQTYDYPGFSAKAAQYWKRYLDIVPDYLPFHRKLAGYHLKAERYEESLPHLIKIFVLEEKSESLALQIADIYSSRLERPDKALLYYEQYSNSFPQDQAVESKIREIRKGLAHQYLPIVENEAGLQLWNDLDLITQKKEEIFLEMADLFHRQKKTEQEIHILRLLHENDREDLNLAFRLADLHHRSGNFDSAYRLLTTLHEHSYADKKYLLLKAEVELQLAREQQSLETLLEYLRHDGNTMTVVQDALSLAGSLGLIRTVTSIWENVPLDCKGTVQCLDLNLAYVEALRKNGLYGPADDLYGRLLKTATDDVEALARLYFHIADTLLQREHVFEAEQIVRQMLARDMQADNAIRKLIEISMEDEGIIQAASWLDLLAKRQGIDDLEDHEEPLPEDIHFFKIRLLMGEKEYGDAVKLLVNHPEYLRGRVDSPFVQRSDLYLARIYFNQEMYDECLQALERLNRSGFDNEEMFVIREMTSRRMRDNGDTVGEETSGSFSDLLTRAELYRQYAQADRALKKVEAALQEIPSSMTARILKVKVLSSLSRFREALELIKTIAEEYPEQKYFTKLMLDLEFRSGNFREIVEKVEKKEEEVVQAAAMPGEQSSENLYFWKKLLLARALWAQNRRAEAIEVYDSLLEVPVDAVFLEKMELENINFILPPLKKPFWKAIPFITPNESDDLATVMEPRYFARNIGKPVDDIAASLYGKYRWQKLVKKELSARKAVEQRQYHRAEKEYLDLLEEEKSQESLFDLATIYDKLGLYGKAAELYDQMKEKGPLYPGLDEYLQSNMLKRQPRISTTFYIDSREGREGYIDLEKKSFGIEGWLMPSHDQEISASLFHNFYSPRNGNPKTESDRFIGTYSTYFENSVDLNISFGLDMPSDSGTNEILYKFELIRRLNKSLEMYGRFRQDLVEDTIRSVSDSIISRDLETGLKYDVFPRLFLGADFRYRMYSDDNEQSRYKVWSMYHLFGEINQFKLKYSYENIRNSDENVGRDPALMNDFRSEDRVYWSPEHYWQHLFTLHFQHYFDESIRPEDPLSYCTFEYSYGYEADDQQFHELDLNIFLEINRHFLLKGNFNKQNGDDYEETQAAFSLIYRW